MKRWILPLSLFFRVSVDSFEKNLSFADRQNLLYRLDSLPAFLQYRRELLHVCSSQHGDACLSEVGDALEDRGGG